ncbi:D-amino acid dehydrogenase [Ferrovum sp. PN-J185]|uniref:D-amino acid dehydrogenase n=1 Tax=Ferrovum sp. PN-J185 TaxID=1356306 RepID=UPI001E3D96C6|nr:D-amino acid dehydrogenase [Ferrovum sp. PN-J185]MCC6068420.1 D-amino acid dehydrogenase [Ferrovum sp. PN-J185]MDE1891526.1 D-amino acid dehydrogenase [Betaproteobacteria bacterium]MDE2055860.1 D-amino acid dehydrogenase [Betaproteobacteria bacterium]
MSEPSSIIVVGAGVVGVHTAWYLQKNGFQVTLIDQNNDSALDTSFANGSQLSYGHVEPWASKETYPHIIKALFDETSPILFRLRFDFKQWAWILSFLREGTSQRYQYNLKRLLSLAVRSRLAHLNLQQSLHIDYAEQNKGIIHLYSSNDAFQRGIHHAQVVNELGYQRYPVDRVTLNSIEPTLQYSPLSFSGATYCPNDASGDAKVWTQALCRDFISLGGRFLNNTPISSLWHNNRRCQGVIVNNQEHIAAQRVVLCTGVMTPKLIKPLGISVSIYPVKGYSITLPIIDKSIIPQVSLTDDQGKIVISRLGDYLRVAGTAEFVGWDRSLNPQRIEALVKRTREFFPTGLDFNHINPWTGLRPVTPSGYPYIGASPIAGLYFNTGHGTLGWTLSAGSAELLVEQIMQETK